jgi:CRISPR-associated endonuclease/helicase Cas3
LDVKFLAHSARPAEGIPAQSYADHIHAVTALAFENARLASHGTQFRQFFIDSLRLAAEYHDLGKLDPLNQKVLSSNNVEGGLPVNHVDAGVATMVRRAKDAAASLAALLIYSHHRGLPDASEIFNNHLRDIDRNEQFGSTKERTDQWLDRYLEWHQGDVNSKSLGDASNSNLPPNAQIAARIALSCLVDADHSDTAQNYGQSQPSTFVPLNPAERLTRLDEYIASLNTGPQSERNKLRAKVYDACRTASTKRGIVSCDSPVGSGKTTAIMAHLLRVTSEHNLRRVFVVLPYTNIINQSVDVYRKCLVMNGENPEHVVAAHHHRAEFSDLQSRSLTYLWEAPIIVTTAVQFFETLAAARTGALRKLHQLANSAVFIDEAHAALPAHLWPTAWRWLNGLQQDWQCHFVLGSGSLAQFWTLPEFSDPPSAVPSIISETPSKSSEEFEAKRIAYQSHPKPLSLEQLVDFIAETEGPRLLIVNTVQSAAFIASVLKTHPKSNDVEHLSTSLTPNDRAKTLDRIRARLVDKQDKAWTLVATSCVEAGVDISFRTGFRERASLNSLLQTSGRVNRNGEFGTADVWDIQLIHDDCLRRHPAFENSAIVLGELFEKGMVLPENCTYAMQKEIRRAGMKTEAELIQKLEAKRQFAEVERHFRVIESNTIIAVVERSLKRKLRNRDKVSFQELQNGSVQIYSNRVTDFAIASIAERPGVYEWTLEYNSFLGYMAGVIGQVDFLCDGGAFI